VQRCPTRRRGTAIAYSTTIRVPWCLASDVTFERLAEEAWGTLMGMGPKETVSFNRVGVYEASN